MIARNVYVRRIWSLASRGRFCCLSVFCFFNQSGWYVNANYESNHLKTPNFLSSKFVSLNFVHLLINLLPSSLWKFHHLQTDRRVLIQAVYAFSSHADSCFCDLGAAFRADTHFEVFGSKGCLYLGCNRQCKQLFVPESLRRAKSGLS